MTIRPIKITDYDQLIDFWKENYIVTPLDEYNRVEIFLKKNPGFSFIVEEKGEILGTVLGSYDGRRGSLQKVVVSKQLRGKGIGQKLVSKALKRLEVAGAIDIRFSTSEELAGFYEKCGFTKENKPLMVMRNFSFK